MEIPDDCDRLAEPVPPPAIVKNEDLGVRAGRYAAALGQANGRLKETKSCNEKVRAAFQEGKKP